MISFKLFGFYNGVLRFSSSDSSKNACLIFAYVVFIVGYVYRIGLLPNKPKTF